MTENPRSLELLRDGVAALLAARGAGAESAVVGRGTLHLLPGVHRWSLGSREVDAQTFELSLDAPAFARLAAMSGGRERVKDALSDAVSTGQTMLADLFVVLALPGIEAGWGHAYRSAPRKDWDPPTDGPAVLAGAVALLDAEGHAPAARLLERCRLSYAEVAASDDSPLRRWVVSVSPLDMVEAQRAQLTEHVRRAVTLAATRPREIVASVELAVVLNR